ncbi:MAG: (Fe-S)-binding protein [Gemmatimonadota bacterium]|nr:(Fe-S)-binding protein [Gemmatimonadota bacterium]
MELTPNVKTALTALEGKLNLAMSTYLEACTHCGLCADACHLYRTDPEVKHIPSFKADTVRKVYQKYFTPTGKFTPWLFGLKELTDDTMEDWVEPVFQCTMCRRCTIECPIGIDNAAIIATARQILTAIGKAPPTLMEHGQRACDVGSPLGVTQDNFRDRIAWIEEELQEEFDNDDFTIPVDVVGADILFIPASLELMKYPQTVQACIKIFEAAGASWTMSSTRYDVTNFGMFLGDPKITKLIAKRDIEEAEKLKVKTVVTSECGHAYRALRWEAPNWFQQELPFDVKNIVELADKWVTEGKLKLDRSKNTRPVTYHDPCNITRNGGVIEEPRRLLGASVKEFRDMTPNRERNWCCGGGGGFHSMPEYEDVRLKSGGMKANQIQSTKAEVVATTCANCQIQLNDLNDHYELDVECVSVTELVAEALQM